MAPPFNDIVTEIEGILKRVIPDTKIIKNVFAAFNDSKGLLISIRKAIKNTLKSYKNDILNIEMTISVFGSVGRLSASSLTSDIELLTIYNSDVRNANKICEDLIEETIRRNQNLDFSHKEKIINGESISNLLAYPVLSMDELLNNKNRKIQFLTESKCLHERKFDEKVYSEVLKNYKMLNLHPGGFPPSSFSDDLRDFFSQFYKDAINSPKITNTKITKLFALRNFSSISNRIFFAIRSLDKDFSRSNVYKISTYLRRDDLTKILSGLGPFGKINEIFQGKSSALIPLRNDISRMLQEEKKQLNKAEKMFIEQIEKDLKGLNIAPQTASLTGFVLLILRDYDILLSSLHDSQFIKWLNEQKNDFFTWKTKSEFQYIEKTVKKMAERAQIYLNILKNIVLLMEEHEILNFHCQMPKDLLSLPESDLFLL